MSLEYDNCIKRGKIKPFSRGKALVSKEFVTAKLDLERAGKTYKESDFKWATIQIYYSMFHSARALLYAQNLREHSHYCLFQAMKSLYVDTKKMPGYYVEVFQEAKDLREDADYYNRWSQKGCEKLLKAAEKFLEKAKSIISK
ncbi:MAG: HEPN domain-containing protein [Candidatus Omnitrophica bacterium]|nr:HEPN domain-containing protein [Candidatus Omnitrophota bacterium]